MVASVSSWVLNAVRRDCAGGMVRPGHPPRAKAERGGRSTGARKAADIGNGPGKPVWRYPWSSPSPLNWSLADPRGALMATTPVITVAQLLRDALENAHETLEATMSDV